MIHTHYSLRASSPAYIPLSAHLPPSPSYSKSANRPEHPNNKFFAFSLEDALLSLLIQRGILEENGMISPEFLQNVSLPPWEPVHADSVDFFLDSPVVKTGGPLRTWIEQVMEEASYCGALVTNILLGGDGLYHLLWTSGYIQKALLCLNIPDIETHPAIGAQCSHSPHLIIEICLNSKEDSCLLLLKNSLLSFCPNVRLGPILEENGDCHSFSIYLNTSNQKRIQLKIIENSPAKRSLVGQILAADRNLTETAGKAAKPASLSLPLLDSLYPFPYAEKNWIELSTAQATPWIDLLHKICGIDSMSSGDAETNDSWIRLAHALTKNARWIDRTAINQANRAFWKLYRNGTEGFIQIQARVLSYLKTAPFSGLNAGLAFVYQLCVLFTLTDAEVKALWKIALAELRIRFAEEETCAFFHAITSRLEQSQISFKLIHSLLFLHSFYEAHAQGSSSASAHHISFKFSHTDGELGVQWTFLPGKETLFLQMGLSTAFDSLIKEQIPPAEGKKLEGVAAVFSPHTPLNAAMAIRAAANLHTAGFKFPDIQAGLHSLLQRRCPIAASLALHYLVLQSFYLPFPFRPQSLKEPLLKLCSLLFPSPEIRTLIQNVHTFHQRTGQSCTFTDTQHQRILSGNDSPPLLLVDLIHEGKTSLYGIKRTLYLIFNHTDSLGEAKEANPQLFHTCLDFASSLIDRGKLFAAIELLERLHTRFVGDPGKIWNCVREICARFRFHHFKQERAEDLLRLAKTAAGIIQHNPSLLLGNFRMQEDLTRLLCFFDPARIDRIALAPLVDLLNRRRLRGEWIKLQVLNRESAHAPLALLRTFTRELLDTVVRENSRKEHLTLLYLVLRSGLFTLLQTADPQLFREALLQFFSYWASTNEELPQFYYPTLMQRYLSHLLDSQSPLKVKQVHQTASLLLRMLEPTTHTRLGTTLKELTIRFYKRLLRRPARHHTLAIPLSRSLQHRQLFPTLSLSQFKGFLECLLLSASNPIAEEVFKKYAATYPARSRQAHPSEQIEICAAFIQAPFCDRAFWLEHLNSLHPETPLKEKTCKVLIEWAIQELEGDIPPLPLYRILSLQTHANPGNYLAFLDRLLSKLYQTRDSLESLYVLHTDRVRIKNSRLFGFFQRHCELAALEAFKTDNPHSLWGEILKEYGIASLRCTPERMKSAAASGSPEEKKLLLVLWPSFAESPECAELTSFEQLNCWKYFLEIALESNLEDYAPLLEKKPAIDALGIDQPEELLHPVYRLLLVGSLQKRRHPLLDTSRHFPLLIELRNACTIEEPPEIRQKDTAEIDFPLIRLFAARPTLKGIRLAIRLLQRATGSFPLESTKNPLLEESAQLLCTLAAKAKNKKWLTDEAIQDGLLALSEHLREAQAPLFPLLQTAWHLTSLNQDRATEESLRLILNGCDKHPDSESEKTETAALYRKFLPLLLQKCRSSFHFHLAEQCLSSKYCGRWTDQAFKNHTQGLLILHHLKTVLASKDRQSEDIFAALKHYCRGADAFPPDSETGETAFLLFLDLCAIFSEQSPNPATWEPLVASLRIPTGVSPLASVGKSSPREFIVRVFAFVKKLLHFFRQRTLPEESPFGPLFDYCRNAMAQDWIAFFRLQPENAATIFLEYSNYPPYFPTSDPLAHRIDCLQWAIDLFKIPLNPKQRGCALNILNEQIKMATIILEDSDVKTQEKEKFIDILAHSPLFEPKNSLLSRLEKVNFLKRLILVTYPEDEKLYARFRAQCAETLRKAREGGVFYKNHLSYVMLHFFLTDRLPDNSQLHIDELEDLVVTCLKIHACHVNFSCIQRGCGILESYAYLLTSGSLVEAYAFLMSKIVLECEPEYQYLHIQKVLKSTLKIAEVCKDRPTPWFLDLTLIIFSAIHSLPISRPLSPEASNWYRKMKDCLVAHLNQICDYGLFQGHPKAMKRLLEIVGALRSLLS